MTRTVEQLADQLEIQNVLAAYVEAIDTRQWAALDDVFTADAIIDYTELGGSRGTLDETKGFLDAALRGFTRFQHMLGLPLIRLDGDTAHVRTPCYNPMVIEADGRETVLVASIWYRDEFVRTADGWRIQQRHEERNYLR